MIKHIRIYNRKRTVSSTNKSWVLGTAICKRIKMEHYLIPYREINLKEIKDLKIRPGTIKLLEGNINGKLY